MSSIDHNLKRDSYDPKFLSPEPQQEHVDSAAAEIGKQLNAMYNDPAASQPESEMAPAEPEALRGAEQNDPEPEPEPESEDAA